MGLTFSVIIPVYHEIFTINKTIHHLEDCMAAHEAEIIVVDGCPGGETLRVIQSGQVRKIVSVRGRGRQMNAGARVAAGDILIFLHADTRLPGDAPAQISRAMDDRACVAGAFDLKIDSARPIFRMIERAASLRSRWTGIPYGDQAIFMRRDDFQRLGGYEDIPIMEDVALMRRIKKDKGKVRIVDANVTTSARRWEEEGLLYGTLRNWVLISLYLLGAKPEKLVRFYR
jgi:rSAM/selenodomain-associated transferase 2